MLHLDIVVDSFNTFSIILVEELTMHCNGANIPYNSLDNTKTIFNIQYISVLDSLEIREKCPVNVEDCTSYSFL